MSWRVFMLETCCDVGWRRRNRLSSHSTNRPTLFVLVAKLGLSSATFQTPSLQENFHFLGGGDFTPFVSQLFCSTAFFPQEEWKLDRYQTPGLLFFAPWLTFLFRIFERRLLFISADQNLGRRWHHKKKCPLTAWGFSVKSKQRECHRLQTNGVCSEFGAGLT